MQAENRPNFFDFGRPGSMKRYVRADKQGKLVLLRETHNIAMGKRLQEATWDAI
jgi:hypothetical protein